MQSVIVGPVGLTNGSANDTYCTHKLLACLLSVRSISDLVGPSPLSEVHEGYEPGEIGPVYG